MKILLKTIAVLFLLTVSAVAQPATAKFATWVQPASDTINLTNALSTSQVMEIVSTMIDETISISVTANERTISFGRRPNDLAIPVPFVVAGPATVVFQRTSSGGLGGMITYRIYDKEKPVIIR
jgi:hypothetical protein